MSTTPNQWMRLRLFGRDTKNTKNTKKLRHRPLGFEGMESRELMSANLLAPAIAPWCDAVVCQGRLADAPANDIQVGAGQTVAKPSNPGVNASNAERVTSEIVGGLFNTINNKIPENTFKTAVKILGDGQIKIGNTVVGPKSGPQTVTFVVTVNNVNVEVTGTLNVVQKIVKPLRKDGTPGVATTYVFEFKDQFQKDGAIVYTQFSGNNVGSLSSQHNMVKNSLMGKVAYLREGRGTNGRCSTTFKGNLQASASVPNAPANAGEWASFQDGSHHRRNVRPPRPFVDRLADGLEGAAFQVGAMEGLEAAMPQRHELNRDVVSPFDAPAAPASIPSGLQTPWAVTDQAFAELFAR